MKQFTDEALDLPCYPHLCCDVCASVCMCEDSNPDVSFRDQLSESVPFPSSCELSTQDPVTPPISSGEAEGATYRIIVRVCYPKPMQQLLLG